MADQLYFSRDSKVYVNIGNDQWEIPVLDGFSFSQATNSSEITLSEAESTSGVSRRGRQMFNDSLAPAEWSFSTYMRPFESAGAGSNESGHHHAVEEVLWALMVGNAAYSASSAGTGKATAIDTKVVAAALSGGDKIGSDKSGTITDVETDGGGNGIHVTVSYTESSGAFDIALASEGGSGYEINDKIFVSKEQVAAALGVALSKVNQDMGADIQAIGATSGTTFTGFARDGDDLDIDFENSNKATLGTADIYFELGGASSGTKAVYKLSKCVVNEASIDFDIEGIATINWSGMGSLIEEVTAVPSGGTSRTEPNALTNTNNYIRNRLTSLTATEASANGGTTYDLVLTGGNVTVSNNITYLTPETLGEVNIPLGHVTGTRTISGSFTCYLNMESSSSADLFEDLIENTTLVTNSHNLLFKVGGTGSPRLEMAMPTCHLEVPTHSIEDIISIETNFHALPSGFENEDELTLKYVGASLS